MEKISIKFLPCLRREHGSRKKHEMGICKMPNCLCLCLLPHFGYRMSFKWTPNISFIFSLLLSVLMSSACMSHIIQEAVLFSSQSFDVRLLPPNTSESPKKIWKCSLPERFLFLFQYDCHKILFLECYFCN